MEFYKPNRYRDVDQTKTVRTIEAFRLESIQSDTARKAVRNIAYCFGITLAITVGGLEPTNVAFFGIDLGKEGTWPLTTIIAALALYFAVIGGASWWHDLSQYRDEYNANRTLQREAVDQCISNVNNSLNLTGPERVKNLDESSWKEVLQLHKKLFDEGRDHSMTQYKNESGRTGHQIEEYKSHEDRIDKREQYEQQATESFEEILRIRKLTPGRQRFYWFWLGTHYVLPVLFLVLTIEIAVLNYLQ